ncbi:hypothetical protein UlMin_032203 [Ulmus minor]
MESKNHQLHIFFLPFMAQGHMIPIMDMAKLVASRGSKATIIITSYFSPFLSKTLQKIRVSGTQIDHLIIKFPCEEVGLPEGIESLHMANTPEFALKFFKATTLLGPQLDHLLQQHRPDSLVSDMFFHWSTDVASKHGIPRLIFDETGYFSSCGSLCMYLHEPQKRVLSDSEAFLIPNMPGEIEFTRNKLPDFVKEGDETHFPQLYKSIKDAELKSFGVLINSFYELEPAYADHYRKVLGVKAWQIGPLFLYDKRIKERTIRGREASIDEHECLKWLDSHTSNSVIYISFGSLVNFSEAQLLDIAMGIEASGQKFIWVVKKETKEGLRQEWLPEGFEKRMEGKGFIIRGWAPQVLILEHEAIGGFVTHCGWNSTLEAVTAGVPMVTWPVSAEQFYNEKLVTQVLGIGVEVGAQKWTKFVGDDSVKKEDIEKAVMRVMVGEEAEKMRRKAKELGEMARRAVEEGGSSQLELDAMLEELRQHIKPIASS